MSHPSNTPPRPVVRSKCLIEGCDRLEELANGRSAGGLCAGHRKRKVRESARPIEEPLNERIARRVRPRQALRQAVVEVGAVDTGPGGEKAYARAIARVEYYAMRWAMSVLRKRPSK